MAEHVLPNIETGGEGESRRGREDQPLTWRDKLRRKLERKHKSTPVESSLPSERVTFAEFFKGMFKDADKVSSKEKPSWIDRAFDEREAKQKSESNTSSEHQFEQLPNADKSEFHVIVAQRFKDAGERFVNFITRNYQETEPQTDDETENSHIDKKFDIEQAPPFDFAGRINSEPTRVKSREHNSLDQEPASAVDRNEQDKPGQSGGPVIDRYVPIGASRIDTPGVVTYEYTTKKRDLITSTFIGSYGLSRYEQRKTKQKFERKLKKRDRKIAGLEEDHAKMDRDIETLERHVGVNLLKAESADKRQYLEVRRNAPTHTEYARPAIAEKKQPTINHHDKARQAREIGYEDLKPSKPSIISTPERTSGPSAEIHNVQSSYREELHVSDMSAAEVLREAKAVGGESFDREYANPEKKHFLRSDRAESARSTVGAVSVQEVLEQRHVNQNTAQSNSKSVINRARESYDLDTKSGVNNWIATGVILALVFLSILFAVAT